jgi:hypothetical protein
MKRKSPPTKTYKTSAKRFKPSPALAVRTKSVSIGEELKYADTAIAGDATTTETVISLSSIAAGDTALTRDGNRAIYKSVELRINVANEAATQNNTVRFVVVKSMQANQAAPTWNTGAGALTDVFDASTVTARRNVATASRFQIMMDKTIVLNQSTTGALQQAYIHKYFKLPQVLTTYADNQNLIPMTNAYFLMYVGSTAAGVVDTDVVGTARLRFVG